MSVVPCDFVILFYLTVVVMVLWFWQAIALFFSSGILFEFTGPDLFM